MGGLRSYGIPFLLFAGLLLLRMGMLFAHEKPQALFSHIAETAVVEGRIIADPERRDTSLHATIALDAIDGMAARGTILAILPRPTQLSYGDRVEISGELELPEAFETDTGRTFDYPHYLQAHGIAALMRYATLQDAQEGGFSLQGALFSLKHAFEHSLERLLPEPDVSLMEGIVLGERRGIPQAVNQAFIASGLVHMVVLSGYNMSVVSDSMLRFFSLFLPKTFALASGGIGVVLFAIMAGAGATTVRACIMGLIAILARYLNRPAAALRALFFAAAGMILWNPLSALYDPSFILSVLATFGLITLSPWIEGHLRFLPERAGIRANAASTVSVQFFVMPALLYFTGVLSIVALPANVLALPLVPYAMLTGFFMGLVGLLHPLAGLPFALIADLLLRSIMTIARLATALPFSSLLVPAYPAWVAALAYAPLTAFAIAKYRSASRTPTS